MNKYEKSYKYIEEYFKIYPLHQLDIEHLANIKELVDKSTPKKKINGIHNKLVRDKIPEIIEASGKKANYRVLTDPNEILNALVDKVIEEANELKAAINGDGDTSEEFYDLVEVVASISSELPTLNINDWHNKMLEKGSFEKHIFLESVEE